jgi:hypothetical protein
MDAREDAAKDAFYFMLFACLKGAPASDKLIVLGDFNAGLGSAWQEQGGITGKFHLHRGATEPSDNGARLLDSGPPTPFSSTTVRIWQRGSMPLPNAGTSRIIFWSLVAPCRG